MQAIESPLQSTQLTEVFQTTQGSIYQSDDERCWYVDFAGKFARFDYRSLLLLKKSVYNINIEATLLKSNKSADIEIVFICACDHCYVLSTIEVIALKELLQGAFAMFELNNIIHDRLFRLAV
jgi:hypothetical protein